MERKEPGFGPFTLDGRRKLLLRERSARDRSVSGVALSLKLFWLQEAVSFRRPICWTSPGLGRA